VAVVFEVTPQIDAQCYQPSRCILISFGSKASAYEEVLVTVLGTLLSLVA
jgi:hypothetical protein